MDVPISPGDMESFHQLSSKNKPIIVKFLAPVVQKVDSAIQRINIYPLDSAIGFPDTYPLDRDLSGG